MRGEAETTFRRIDWSCGGPPSTHPAISESCGWVESSRRRKTIMLGVAAGTRNPIDRRLGHAPPRSEPDAQSCGRRAEHAKGHRRPMRTSVESWAKRTGDPWNADAISRTVRKTAKSPGA